VTAPAHRDDDTPVSAPFAVRPLVVLDRHPPDSDPLDQIRSGEATEMLADLGQHFNIDGVQAQTVPKAGTGGHGDRERGRDRPQPLPACACCHPIQAPSGKASQ
jgi:hypothetical protein